MDVAKDRGGREGGLVLVALWVVYSDFFEGVAVWAAEVLVWRLVLQQGLGSSGGEEEVEDEEGDVGHGLLVRGVS